MSQCSHKKINFLKTLLETEKLRETGHGGGEILQSTVVNYLLCHRTLAMCMSFCTITLFSGDDGRPIITTLQKWLPSAVLVRPLKSC